MKLSILIPSTPDRTEMVRALGESILASMPQYEVEFHNHSADDIDYKLVKIGDVVEVLVVTDNKIMTIGEKRELMYTMASGLYSWQIDSDDQIAPNAIELILAAIEQNPDCICYKELVDIDGAISHSNFSLDYEDWEGEGHIPFEDGFVYHRTPFFKTPIKTALCQQVGVKHIRWAEDIDFARRIKPLLKTQVYIPEFIYHYIHRSSPHNERYGITE